MAKAPNPPPHFEKPPAPEAPPAIRAKKLGPSFRFYFDDFLGGTIHFTAADVGAYMLMLMHQFAAGSVPSESRKLCRIARRKPSQLKTVLEKFEKDENGNYVNSKMAQVRLEQMAYIEKKSYAGKVSAKSRASTPVEHASEQVLQHTGEQTTNLPLPLPYIPKKKEDDSDKRAAELPKELRLNPPTLDDVKNAAATIGVSADECEKFFYHYDKKGWIDNAGNPLTSLPSALASWKIKGAEIKAAAKPAPRSNPWTGQESHPPPQRQIWQIQADIDTLKKRKRDLNEKRRFEYPQNREKYAEDWQMHEKLKKQIEDLQKELSQ